MSPSEMFERCLEIRREVVGAECCLGAIWSRPGLDRHAREVIEDAAQEH